MLEPLEGGEGGAASLGAFNIQPGADIAGDSKRLWSALAETSRATASRFSRMVSELRILTHSVAPFSFNNEALPSEGGGEEKRRARALELTRVLHSTSREF